MTENAAGSMQISPGRTRVDVAAGTFEPGTALTMTPVNAPDGVGGEGVLSPFIEVDAGGQQPRKSLRVSMRIDPARVDASDPVVLARFENGALVPYPTQFDRTTGKLVAEVDHLSILVAVAWSAAKITVAALAGGAVVVRAVEGWNDGEFHSFDRGYETRGGFQIFYRSKKLGAAVRRRGPGDKGEHPLLITVIGNALDEALRVYNSDPTFAAFDLDPQALPTVFVYPLAGGVMGDTPGTGNAIWMSSNLEYDHARSTAAHELFHIYQLGIMGASSMQTHLWWADATCEWAASVVARGPFLSAHLPFVTENHPEPVLSGFGERLNPKTDDRYLAGNAARFIEQTCPGTMIRSLQRLRDSAGSAWFSAMQDATDGSCSSFEDVLHEYFLRYYGVPGDGWGEPDRVGRLNDYLLTADRPPLHEVRRVLPPASAQYARFRVGNSGRKGTLVVKASGEARANLYLAKAGRSLAPPPLAAFGDPVSGTEVGERGVAIEGFGDGRRGVDANDARVVMSNPSPEPSDANLAFRLIEAPTVLSVVEKAGGPGFPSRTFDLEWTAPKLAKYPGELGDYDVEERTRGGWRVVETAGPTATSSSIAVERFSAAPGTKVTLRVVAKDRDGNRGPPSVPVSLERPAEAAKPKPKSKPQRKPKPRPKPKPNPRPQAKISCYQACLHMCRPKSTFACTDRDGARMTARKYCDGLQSMPQKATKWDWGFATECSAHVPKAWSDKHPPKPRNPNRPPGI